MTRYYYSSPSSTGTVLTSRDLSVWVPNPFSVCTHQKNYLSNPRVSLSLRNSQQKDMSCVFMHQPCRNGCYSVNNMTNGIWNSGYLDSREGMTKERGGWKGCDKWKSYLQEVSSDVFYYVDKDTIYKRALEWERQGGCVLVSVLHSRRMFAWNIENKN